MPLPTFTDANVNSYLAGIADNQSELNDLASDLDSNFVTALTSRFDLSPWQLARIAYFHNFLKSDIVNAVARVANHHDTEPDKPIVPLVTGIVDTGGGSTGAYEAKAELSVSWDPTTGEVEFDINIEVDC